MAVLGLMAAMAVLGLKEAQTFAAEDEHSAKQQQQGWLGIFAEF
jgi:hypothetical protein